MKNKLLSQNLSNHLPSRRMHNANGIWIIRGSDLLEIKLSISLEMTFLCLFFSHVHFQITESWIKNH